MEAYQIVKENEKVNKLGEQGWGLTINDMAAFQSGFPILVSKAFSVPRDAKIVKDVALRWLNAMANKSPENLKALRKDGFSFGRVHYEATGETKYEARTTKSVLTWRIEGNWSDEDDPLVYITFGNPMLMTPALANKGIIDKYVPQEVLAKALESGSIKIVEVAEEKPDA